MPPIGIMRKWYTRPEHPTSFTGRNRVRKWHGISDSKSRKVLDGIQSYSMHREVKRPRARNPFFVYRKREHVQADLIEVGQLSDENDGVQYLLTVIDMFSKFAVCIPMKNKTQKASITAFKKVLPIIKPEVLMTDSGGEFMGGNVTRFFRENSIKHFTPGSDIKCAGVERLNKTIQRKMYHYMTSKGTDRYIEVLPKLLNSYNNTVHSRLGITPKNAEKPENALLVRDMLNRHYLSFFKRKSSPKFKFKLGDTVRVSKIKHPFMRSYKHQSNEELFKIVEVRKNMPIPMYILKSWESLDVIKGAFYESELTRVDLEAWNIERVLKRRVKNGKEQARVKWEGFHNKFNSWIPAENVVDIRR